MDLTVIVDEGRQGLFAVLRVLRLLRCCGFHLGLPSPETSSKHVSTFEHM